MDAAGASAVRLLDALRSGPDGRLLLHGVRRLPVAVFDDLSGRAHAEQEYVRLSYNPVPSAPTPGTGELVLTLRKRPFAVAADEGLVGLEAAVRAMGSRLLVECSITDDEDWPTALYLPSEGDMADLVRLVRLYRRWPLDRDMVSWRIFCFRAFDWAISQHDRLVVEYAGYRRRPPDYLLEHPFCMVRCESRVREPDPGSRHVPVAELLVASTGDLVMAVKPHSTELHGFLVGHRGRLLDMVAVGDRPEGARRPVQRMALVSR